MRERFRNYKTGRKMVMAFLSIIVLYVVTVTAAIINVCLLYTSDAADD